MEREREEEEGQEEGVQRLLPVQLRRESGEYSQHGAREVCNWRVNV